MKDYFVYLPETPQAAVWGCLAASAGCAHVPPNGVYPPQRHPDDHHFTWTAGRILQAHQFVLLTAGGGVLESDNPRRTWELSSGNLFVLFPGIWHRYAPHAQTGWVEHWIELRGPALEQATKRGLISPEHPVIDTRSEPAICDVFSRIHTWASDRAVAHQDLLATLGLHLLALLEHSNRDPSDHIGEKVQRAQALLTARADHPIDLTGLAHELQMGYSHFRQVFKARTGVSPKRFHQQLRIRRAQEFLVNSCKSLEEIAELLGFSSAFHLSRQFKEIIGIPPRDWRARMVRGKRVQ
jgi:AraC-like DNA-binding protein